METVKIDELLKHKAYIDANTMMKITGAILKGVTHVDVPVGTLQKLQKMSGKK